MLYLVATTGYPNYGDELIAASWLRWLARNRPGDPVWLDCPEPGNTAALLHRLHPNVHFTDTLWRLCRRHGLDAWASAREAQSAVADAGRAPFWAAGIELLAEADSAHLLGGGFLNRMWPHHVGLLAGMVEMRRRYGTRLAATGQGLTPMRAADADLVRTLLARFDLVEVRDRPSTAMLPPLHAAVEGVERLPDGAVVGTDDAFLMPEAFLTSEDATPEVMLCVQSDLLEHGDGVAQLAEIVRATLRRWEIAGERLGVVECIPQVDTAIWRRVQSDFPGARFYPLAEVLEHGFPARAGQSWLSSRFHPHLLAAVAGASGATLEVLADYYGPKHASLRALGSGWAPATQTHTRPVGGGFDRATTDRLRTHKQHMAKRIYG